MLHTCVYFLRTRYQIAPRVLHFSAKSSREYRDCIKRRRDKIGITRHIMMHQVLYIVQLPNEEGDMHII